MRKVIRKSVRCRSVIATMSNVSDYYGVFVISDENRGKNRIKNRLPVVGTGTNKATVPAPRKAKTMTTKKRQEYAE